MSGNVTIVKVGTSDSEKEELLEGVGLNKSTIRHCLEVGNSSYDEVEERTPTVAPLGKEAITVPRPPVKDNVYAMPDRKTINVVRGKLKS